MNQIKMSAQDKAWQASCDARTLMDAEGIKSNASRLRLATAEAKRVAVEAEKAAQQKKSQAAAIQRKPAKKGK